MKVNNSSDLTWQILALISIIAIVFASVLWILDRSQPLGWDEADYINFIHWNKWVLDRLGWLPLLSGWLKEDASRPPAYRILAMPMAILFDTDPTPLRLNSLLFFIFGLGFVYLAGKNIAGKIAGSFSVIAVVLSPVIINYSRYFQTEYTLYFIVPATFYFLFRDWDDPSSRSKYSWIGLGVCLGLGSISKLTFAAIAGPMMLATMVLRKLQIIRSPAFKHLWWASGLGMVILLPWWVINFTRAWEFARFASNYGANSVGDPGELTTVVNWTSILIQTGLGLPLAIVIIATPIAFLIGRRNQTIELTRGQVSALIVCTASFLPFWIFGLCGNNHNPRLISPSLIPLALAAGILAAKPLKSYRWLEILAASLLTFQLTISVAPYPNAPRYKSLAMKTFMTPWRNSQTQYLLLLNPGTVMVRYEEYNWHLLRDLCIDRGIVKPKIAHLGNFLWVNSPMINFPWVQNNRRLLSTTNLWKNRQAPLEWNKAIAVIADSDTIVIQPPSPNNTPDLNQYSQELIAWLRQNQDFSDPIVLKLGRFQSKSILVFFRNSQTSDEKVSSFSSMAIDTSK